MNNNNTFDNNNSSSTTNTGTWFSTSTFPSTTLLNNTVTNATESVVGVIGPATNLAVNNGKALFSSVSSSITQVLSSSSSTSSTSTSTPSTPTRNNNSNNINNPQDIESQQPLSLLSNGISNIGATLGGYLPVLGSSAAVTNGSTTPAPVSPPPNTNEWTCGLSYAQRFQAFLLLGCGSVTLYFASFFVFLPLILITPSKFATSFTFGSLFWLAAFAMLRGPKSTILSLLQKEKLPFTIAYFASIVLSLYSTLIVQSYFFVLLAVIIQLVAALWYSSSYIPGGTAAFSALGRMLWTTSRTLVGGLLR